ncbi:hypothetical protein TEQG_00584 [Trichophyton equinum CBS 127.97]|uniref:Uncharacterized protein n=1 Tax=Trichophyton equinum (strain ATCC MYA-4606 / CBS 127.97) TaxID=559882 RepID=F2PHX5_TRIEC|nr:hypothetical protein TEQG_00584 [Trichophyton equinum CBS 127.97]
MDVDVYAVFIYRQRLCWLAFLPTAFWPFLALLATPPAVGREEEDEKEDEKEEEEEEEEEERKEREAQEERLVDGRACWLAVSVPLACSLEACLKPSLPGKRRREEEEEEAEAEKQRAASERARRTG